jgi:hypothetical protein
VTARYTAAIIPNSYGPRWVVYDHQDPDSPEEPVVVWLHVGGDGPYPPEIPVEYLDAVLRAWWQTWQTVERLTDEIEAS